MATTTDTKPAVTLEQIRGRTIYYALAEPPNSATQRQISQLVTAIDGVLSCEIDFYNSQTLCVSVIGQFANVNEIARVVTIVVQNTLAGTEPVKIKTATSFTGDFGVVETDYRNTDPALRDALFELGLRDVAFVAGGYNISLYAGGTSPNGLKKKLRDAVEAFYAGRLPRRPLQYVLADTPDANRFEWRLNRRLDNGQRDELLEKLSNIAGLTNVYFNSNGHTIIGERANSFFNKSRLALETIIVVEEFFEQLDKQS